MAIYPTSSHHTQLALFLATLCTSLLLSSCGGSGGGGSASSTTPVAIEQPASTPEPEVAELATSDTTLDMDLATLPDDAAALIAMPFFHVAPGILPEPADVDAYNGNSSAHLPPAQQQLALSSREVSTQRLTVRGIQTASALRILRNQAPSPDGSAVPMASGTTIATYTPAQIRAAYGLPELPASGNPLSAAQAAQMGAGQTIYIVDAYHDPNVVAELAAFNQKFGLPGCTTQTIAPNASLPIPAASTSGCEFSVVYSTASSGMTSTPPAYNEGWATEIAMDVQWAHAIAPLARIVLIEAPSASLDSLLGAIKLANLMGPGIVSMSFGANEGNWTANVDAAFNAANMTYLAATGDNGVSVSWPSVSPNVVAVGGTTLTYTGTGARSETAWSGTGGGVSAYTATPSYQSSNVPGMGNAARRTVADVALNADPASGQYIAIMSPGSTAVKWISAGGTSISAPQWAGVMAMANANRALVGKPALGAPHALLYGQVSTAPATYSSTFSDILKGSHGTCTLCTAKTGYDALTGLGTPNVTSLVSTLTGTSTAIPPSVTPANISGKVGTALSFTASVNAINPLSYTLHNAPGGMSINASGVVTWATPLYGTYSVIVIAKDTKTGLEGRGIYTVSITQPAAPVVTAAAVNGTAKVALSFPVTVTASNPVSYTLNGAPAGMVITSKGVISWAVPVTGTYTVTVIAKDTKTGLSGQGTIKIAISVPQPPVVNTATISGQQGTLLAFTASATAPNPATFTMTGAPSGMSISSAGQVSWASPIAGTYSVTIIAKDSKTGLSGQGVYTIQIAKTGPVISTTPITGIAGRPITGKISITAPGAKWVSISIAGAPLGMVFSASGQTITAYWAKPVTGNYSLKIDVIDSTGQKAQATLAITVSAK